MTKQDVTKLLAILCAYYGKPKSDAADMVNAWHILLKDHDYTVAEQACIEYAKNDRREYAQFPTIGNILASIEEEEKCFLRIRRLAREEYTYNYLDKRCMKWISPERYVNLQKCGTEYLDNNFKEIRSTLIRSYMLENKT